MRLSRLFQISRPLDQTSNTSESSNVVNVDRDTIKEDDAYSKGGIRQLSQQLNVIESLKRFMDLVRGNVPDVSWGIVTYTTYTRANCVPFLIEFQHKHKRGLCKNRGTYTAEHLRCDYTLK